MIHDSTASRLMSPLPVIGQNHDLHGETGSSRSQATMRAELDIDVRNLWSGSCLSAGVPLCSSVRLPSSATHPPHSG